MEHDITPAPIVRDDASPALERRDRWRQQVLSRLRLRGAMQDYLIVGLGGFLGALLRYIIGGWVTERLGTTFPFGTLLINLSGCFVIGLLLTIISERFIAPPGVRLFLAIGVLGAYTTFSTFSFESLALIQARAYVLAAVNVLGSMILGILAVTLGVMLGRIV